MKIKLIHTLQTEKLLRSRNIPVFKKSFDIKSAIAPIEYEKNFISTDTQLKWLKEILEKCPSKNFNYAIAGEFDNSKAKIIASLVCLSYYNKNMGTITTEKMPYWHSIYGGMHDKLRDKDTIRTGLLVIDNIAANSTDNKLEKVRDALEKYEGIPKIVILSGINPLKFAREKLFINFNKMLYIANNKIIKI